MPDAGSARPERRSRSTACGQTTCEPGDWVVIRTRNSVYSLAPLGDGRYRAGRRLVSDQRRRGAGRAHRRLHLGRRGDSHAPGGGDRHVPRVRQRRADHEDSRSQADSRRRRRTTEPRLSARLTEDLLCRRRSRRRLLRRAAGPRRARRQLHRARRAPRCHPGERPSRRRTARRFHGQDPAESDPARIGPVDVVVYTVKTYDNATAIPLIAPLRRPGDDAC